MNSPVAGTNDRGLVINGILKFSLSGATYLYWFLSAVCLAPAGAVLLDLIHNFNKQEIILSSSSISVSEGVGSYENELINYNRIQHLSLQKNSKDVFLLIQHTRELTVFGGFWHYKYWEDTFKKAGFDLQESHGQPAVECIKKEVALYDKYEAITSFLSTIRVFPKRFFKLMRRLHANAESYIKAEEEELISLNWYAVMQKPQ